MSGGLPYPIIRDYSQQTATNTDSPVQAGQHNDCSENEMEMAALGCSFQLGQLYDARKEVAISGRTLWDDSQILNSTSTQNQLQSNYQFIQEDNSLNKFDLFGVDSNLKVSVKCGFVKPKGASKFIQDESLQKINQGQRDVLFYQYTNKFQEILLEKFEQLQYLQPLEEKIATHIVMKIEYGVDVVFVFEIQDQEENFDVKLQEIWNKLQVFMSLQGQPKYTKLDEILGMCSKNEINFIKKLKCKVFSDLPVQGYQSFEAAVNLFNQLPFLAQTIQNCIRRVTLMPVSYIIRRFNTNIPHQNFNQISEPQIISNIEALLIQYQEIESRSNALLNLYLVIKSSLLEKQVKIFIALAKNYRVKIYKELEQTIVNFRAGNIELLQVQNVVQQMLVSQINKNLSLYLTEFEQQIEKIQNLFFELALLICSKEKLSEVKRNFEYIVCLEVVIPIIYQNLVQKLRNPDINSRSFLDDIKNQKKQNDEIFSETFNLVEIFKQNNKLIQNARNVKYVIVFVDETFESKFSEINVFLNSHKLPSGIFSSPKNFKFQLGINNASVDLEWQNSDPHPNFYEIVYHPQNYFSLQLQKKIDGHQNSTTIDGLSRNSKYIFKIRKLFSYGFSQFSVEIQSTPFPGKPENLQSIENTLNSIQLTWQQPKIGAWILDHYLVYYKIFGKTEDFKILKTYNTCIQLIDLEFDTIYLCQIKSVCDFGAKEFSQICVKTQTETTLDQIINQDEKIQLKISILGEFGAGKTTIIEKIVTHIFGNEPKNDSPENYSLEIQYEKVNLDVNIFDTAGMEQFNSMSPQILRNANGIFLVYDVANRESFENLDNWLRIAREHCEQNACIIVVGNKIDKKQERQVTTVQGKKFAEKWNLLFVEVSATEGTLIKEIFDLLIYEIVQKIKKEHKKYKIGAGENSKTAVSFFKSEYLDVDETSGPRRLSNENSCCG